MIVLRETVETPAGREVYLKIPERVPVGCQATITVSVPSPETAAYAGYEAPETAIEELMRLAAEKTALRKASGKKPFEGLRGALKDSAALAGDPAEIVKKWRDEWDVHR